MYRDTLGQIWNMYKANLGQTIQFSNSLILDKLTILVFLFQGFLSILRGCPKLVAQVSLSFTIINELISLSSQQAVVYL